MGGTLPVRGDPVEGRVIYVRDRDGELRARLEQLAETQNAQHPGRRASVASVARELVEAALRDRTILARVTA
jgi:hypothetical protein